MCVFECVRISVFGNSSSKSEHSLRSLHVILPACCLPCNINQIRSQTFGPNGFALSLSHRVRSRFDALRVQNTKIMQRRCCIIVVVAIAVVAHHTSFTDCEHTSMHVDDVQINSCSVYLFGCSATASSTSTAPHRTAPHRISPAR